MASPSPRRSPSPVGALLRHWRQARRKSQLALAVAADVSQRHLSFVESGRSTPSREMVLLLARALDVPLRERNSLLVAAGFAPIYRETSLEAPDMVPVRKALQLILRKHEPYPAVVMNRHWDIVTTNAAAERFFALLLGPGAGSGQANVLRSIFDPTGLRVHIANWESVAEALIQRVHRESVGGVADETTRRLLDELLAYPGVPDRWRLPDLAAPAMPVLPVEFRLGGGILRFFSTVTTLGTPQDVTAQELRIECFFPADELTEAHAQAAGAPQST